MSGMEPMLIGAALGGGMSAARGGNPLTGALLGGMGGAVFGGASGLAGSKLAAAAPTGTGALAGGGGSGMFTAGTQLANPMAAGGTYFSAGTPAAAGSLQAGGNAVMTQGAVSAATPAMSAPTLMQTVKEIPNAFGSFSRENPLMTNIGGQMLRDELNPQPMAAATQPGLLRGSPIPLEQQQFAAMTPRQPISLI
jgi:hypothetical protein